MKKIWTTRWYSVLKTKRLPLHNSCALVVSDVSKSSKIECDDECFSDVEEDGCCGYSVNNHGRLWHVGKRQKEGGARGQSLNTSL